MKFLADSSLGRLSTWLRILGYDTVYWRGEADRGFLRKAEREGRAVLTRRRDVLARQHPGVVLFVEKDRVEGQIVEVLGKLDLRPEPDKLFTLCLRCNESLVKSTPEEVRTLVPDYVFRTQNDFRSCPKCRGVYWPGTHRERAMKTLARLLKGQIRVEPRATSHKPQGE
jgi:uncharacterized protein with PIN domain